MSYYRSLKRTDKLVDGKFPVTTPESQGIYSRDIAAFLKQMQQEHIEIHNLQIVRNGYAIVNYKRKPMEQDRMHRIYSSAKGLLTTAVLFAVQEGILSLNEKIVDIFPESIPEGMDPVMKEISLYDILNMASGHDHNIFHELRNTDDWIKGFFEIPLGHKPGEVFSYNNAAPNMVAQIIKKRTGLDVPEYLKPRLLDPLGIQLEIDYNWLDKLEPTTTRMTADGMLRYAVFYSQKGVWDGKQLLREDLVEMVGKRHVPAEGGDPNVDYMTGFGLYGSTIKNGGFIFYGGMTNHAIVFRRENLSVSLLCNERREAHIYYSLAEKILNRTYERELDADEEGYKELLALCENDSIAYPGQSHGDAQLEKAINGRTFVMNANGRDLETIEFRLEDGIQVITKQKGITEVTTCGLDGDWTENDHFLIAEPDYSERPGVRGYIPNEIPGQEKLPVLASAVWVSPQELVIFTRSHFYMSTSRFHCVFGEDGLKINAHTYFLPQDPPEAYYSENMNVLTGVLG